MIKLEGVTKKFMLHKAIDDISITFEKGKIIGVIGENGSGKTTLLKLLVGLLRPSSGSITIDDNRVDRRASERIAYLTDDDYFYPYFTVEELIRYYDSQYLDFDEGKAIEMAAMMKLDLNSKISYLSKGSRARVKIMATLSRSAEYVVLDEPFAGLDPLVRKEIIAGMIQFVDLKKQTLIITTHELKEVEPVLDEVFLLFEGKVLAHKAVEDIRHEYEIDVVNWMERVYEQYHVHI